MPVSPLFTKIVRRTGILFLIAVVAWIIPQLIDFPIVFHFPPGHVQRLSDRVFTYIGVFALFLQGVVWTNALAAHWAERYIETHQANRNDASTIRVVSIFARLVVTAILFVIAMDSLGKSVAGLIAGLGIGGIAVAFALQSILGDLFGAFSIALDKPFVVGDAIQVDDFSGTVERIGLKSTRVRSDNGEELIFANGELLKGRLRNFGNLQQRRVILLLKFDGDTSPEKIARVPVIMRETIERQPNTRFVRSNFKTIGDTTLDVETVFYLTNPSYHIAMDTQQDVLLSVMKQFQQEEIELSAQLEAAQKQKVAGRM